MPICDSLSWMRDGQMKAQHLAKTIGLPIFGSEKWKYTSLRDYSRIQFHQAEPRQTIYDLPNEVESLFSSAQHRLYFYNGEFLANASAASFSDTVIVHSLPHALKADIPDKERIKLLLHREPSSALAGLGWEQQSNFYEGALVVVKRAEVSQKIAIVYLYGRDESNEIDRSLAVFPRNVYLIEAGAKAQIVEYHMAANEISFKVNNASDLVADSESEVSFAQVYAPSLKSYVFNDTRMELHKDSSLDYFNLNVGGSVVRNEQQVLLKQMGARVSFHTLSLLKSDSHIDNNTLIHHLVGNTKSEQMAKSVVGERSKSIFSGRLVIEQEAQKSDASQLNANLLLTESSEAYTRPQLEVNADDVKAAHGATVGQIDEDEIFYLQSRGIAKDLAVQMLASGFQKELIHRMPSAFLRDILIYTLASQEMA